MRRVRALKIALSVAACLAGSTACQFSQLQFRGDHRLTFTSPSPRDKVAAPLTVSWSMKGFTSTGLDGSTDSRRGAYAVFVDRAPMPVGRDLKWLGRGDPACKRDPRCPTPQFLADQGVFVTTSTSVRLQTLPSQNGGVGDEQHYVNVVLLNGAGRRIGESAWYLPFRTARRSL